MRGSTELECRLFDLDLSLKSPFLELLFLLRRLIGEFYPGEFTLPPFKVIARFLFLLENLPMWFIKLIFYRLFLDFVTGLAFECKTDIGLMDSESKTIDLRNSF